MTMLLLLVRILGFIAAAIAIDIRFMDNQLCEGFAAGCEKLAPDQCCYMGDGDCPKYCTTGLAFDWVPRNWEVTLHGSGDWECKNEVMKPFTVEPTRVSSINTRSFCVNMIQGTSGRIFKSGRYSFGRPRAARQIPSAVGDTKDCKRVDTFYLGDGTKYAIDHLEDDAVQNLASEYLSGR